MNSLYDILGLGRSATAEQVEQAYQTRINKLKNVDQSSDQDMIQLRAIKEAYAVLSSANRRAAYDSKLNAASRVTHEVVESAPLPWLKILLVAALFIGGGTYSCNPLSMAAGIATLKILKDKKVDTKKIVGVLEDVKKSSEKGGVIPTALESFIKGIDNKIAMVKGLAKEAGSNKIAAKELNSLIKELSDDSIYIIKNYDALMDVYQKDFVNQCS